MILPEGATEIRYGALADQVERLAGRLRQSGLRPGQAVAIALPNGIEFIVAFLAATRARLVAAPLNALGVEELRFLLESSEAGVVVTTSSASPVRAAARDRNVPVWTASRTATGDVELSGPGLSSSALGAPDAPSSEDDALLLHTSGTTSVPKGVPLTHANVMASLRNIATHYALRRRHGPVVMPLFHGRADRRRPFTLPAR